MKDLAVAAGFPTTRGAMHLADVEPAEHDSTEVARMRAAGCVIIGKTNTPEAGWTGDTFNPVFGATRSPWGTEPFTRRIFRRHFGCDQLGDDPAGNRFRRGRIDPHTLGTHRTVRAQANARSSSQWSGADGSFRPDDGGTDGAADT